MRRCYRDSRAVGTPSCQWRLRRLLVAGRSEARGFLPGSSSRWDASRSVRRSPGERGVRKGERAAPGRGEPLRATRRVGAEAARGPAVCAARPAGGWRGAAGGGGAVRRGSRSLAPDRPPF